MNVSHLLFEALPLIKQFAPTIGGAIGGPVGIAVGYAIPVLAHVFQTSPTDLKTLATKIMSDPEAPDRLKSLEETHANFIQGLLDNINDLSSAEINIKLNWDTNKQLLNQ